jgi:mono/diheme cytochrome c family protein
MARAEFISVDKWFHCGALLFGILFLTAACTPRPGGDSSPKFKQYYVQGEQLYISHCSNCHQENGSGLGLLYPPLDTSDYMQKHLEDVVCIIKNGKEGVLVVNGKSYNQKMPALVISDLEIAEITTYIYNTWSHQRGLVDVKLVSEILKSCDSASSR